MKKNVASQVIGAQMVSATDGSAFTGTAAVVITIDGGTQSASGGTGPTHEGGGFHSYLPTQAETNGDHVAFTFTGSGAVPVTIQIYTTFPQTGDNYTRLGAPAGASIAADIGTVDTVVDGIQTDLSNGTDGLGAIKADTAAILTDTADMQPKLGTPAADVSADIAAVKAETALIVADTNELQTDDIPATLATIAGYLDTEIAAILVDTGATLPATLATIEGKVDTIDANVDSVLADTGTDGVVVAGTPDVNVAQISGSATAADNLEASALGIVSGAVNGGTPTTTAFIADGFTESTDDHFNGRIVVFTSGACAGQASDITDYAGGTQTITVTALTEAPADNDTFVIV